MKRYKKYKNFIIATENEIVYIFTIKKWDCKDFQSYEYMCDDIAEATDWIDINL